ncbi:MAG: peptidase [Cyanobacteriota bacterium]|nr:peptidase [Cyanobacteriota bacterium]
MAEGSPSLPSQSLMLRCRQAHATVAPFVLAPLLLTASTGVAYRVLRDWLGWGREQSHPLMTLHEGEWLKPWLGKHAETLYVLLNGLGLLWMVGSGALMLWQRLQRRAGLKGRGGP